MTFQLVRATACEPDCPEWIAAEGEIQLGTAGTFATFLARLDARRRPVLINSGGGSVSDAMEMGRLIRARGLAVMVAKSWVKPGAPADPTRAAEGDADSYLASCNSACTLALAGGVERYVNQTAYVGVHQVKQPMAQTYVYRRFLVHYVVVDGRKQEVSRDITSESRKTVYSTRVSPPEVNAQIAAYLKQMGVGAEVVDLMQKAPPERLHFMTRPELEASRLATVWTGVGHTAFVFGPGNSGLAGSAIDSEHGRTVLSVEQSWRLPEAPSGARGLTLQLTMRRGGGGVLARFARTGESFVPVRHGLAPAAQELDKLAGFERFASAFYPAEQFCRLVQTGVILALGGPLRPPTHAPGLPDARAPLLAVPLAQFEGVGRVADELCPPVRTAQTSSPPSRAHPRTPPL